MTDAFRNFKPILSTLTPRCLTSDCISRTTLIAVRIARKHPPQDHTAIGRHLVVRHNNARPRSVQACRELSATANPLPNFQCAWLPLQLHSIHFLVARQEFWTAQLLSIQNQTAALEAEAEEAAGAVVP